MTCQCKSRYTIVYTSWTGYRNLVCTVQVTLNKDQTLTSALEAANIDPGSLVHVFYGHCFQVAGDWSDIKGEQYVEFSQAITNW